MNITISNEENGFTFKKTRSRYLAETMTNADYRDNLALLTNTPTQAKFILNSEAGSKRHRPLCKHSSCVLNKIELCPL